MSKIEKALIRLKSKPKDFTWGELQRILAHLGYIELKGSGSRRKFINKKKGVVLSLHEPHPRPILKSYAVEIIVQHLINEGLL
ncbi:MAG: type II toxin-antitoxin system HicA family toxin [Bacteroidota bacterium]